MESALDEMIREKMVNNDKLPQIQGIPNDNGQGYKDYEIKIWLAKPFIDHIIMSNITHKQNRGIYEQHAQKALPSDTIKMVYQLAEHGIEYQKATQLIAEYGIDNIRDSYVYTERQQEKKLAENKKFLFLSYFTSTLEHGWHKTTLKPTKKTTVDKEKKETSVKKVVISAKDYEEPLRTFVKDVVCNLPEMKKVAFKQFGVQSGHILPLWEQYLKEATASPLH